MAQVGRISGPLLTANLERNGIDLKISNTVSSSPVLKLDVTGKRIGIGTDSPIAELQVPSSLNTQNFIATGTVDVADFSLSNKAINVNSGDIIVNSGSLIEASAIATDDIKIEENNIYGTATQANITLNPKDYTYTIGDTQDVYLNAHNSGVLAASQGNSSNSLYAFYKTVLPSGFERGDFNQDGQTDIDDVMGHLAVIRGNTTSGGTYDRVIAALNAGLSKTDIQSDLDVDENLHATGNITFGGTLTLGSGTEDDVTFAADVASNIVPDVDNFYIFGRDTGLDSTTQRLGDTIVDDVIADTASGDAVIINGIDYALGVGNSFFVAEHGDDTNRGDHPQGAFKTIKHALSAVDSSAGGPTTIVVLAGTYTEEFPLTVPSQTNVLGVGFREVIIKPTTATQDKDCFLLTGETTVSNLTVMDFFYNSSNDTGYGFRFADNAVTSTRSPYVQNVSVITKGTPITVTASSTLSVNSQENNPRGITFNNDGTKMFIVGAQGDDVNEYTLSVGFDLSSTVTFIDSFPVTQCPNPTAVKFNTDGTKMFVTGTSNNNVHQYALSTGFDVSTAGFTQTLVTTVDNDNFGLDFNNDGTKMYITGNQTDSIYEFNLSSAFDISTATLNQSVYLNPIDDEPFGIEFNTDGTRMFIVGTKGNGVDEFKLTTGFDISTATHMGFYFVGNNPSGIHISPDGTKMFIIGNQSDLVKSFDLGTSYRVTQDNDPRGFEVGNAGRGALVDGSILNASSTQASMLFHSVTMITPGAIGLRMKDGVRVEWLNCFTYFADIGIKAENGGTGFVSPHDGSTRKFGAEIRSIGSANVYGNQGAVADGNDCLMYLIQHNMAYIGTGSNKENDKTLRIEANETVELNSGKIYFQTTDSLGKFKVGDNFFADFDTGTTSIDANTVAFDALSEIRIDTGNETTFIDGTRIDVGNFVMSGNTLSTSTGDMTIDAAANVVLNSNTNVKANLDLVGNINIGQEFIRLGDGGNDTISFNVDFTQDLFPATSGVHSLGTPAQTWKELFGSQIFSGDIQIVDNVITTTVSNTDLEFVANGTGRIFIENNDVKIDNDLEITGLTTVPELSLTGDVTHTGNATLSKGFDIVGGLTTTNIDVPRDVVLKRFDIKGNVIENTVTNNNFFIQAAGPNLKVPNNKVFIGQDLSVFGDLTITTPSGDAEVVGTVLDPGFFNDKIYTFTANGVTYTYGPTGDPGTPTDAYDGNYFLGLNNLGAPGFSCTVGSVEGGGPLPIKLVYTPQSANDVLILANTNGWAHLGMTPGTYQGASTTGLTISGVMEANEIDTGKILFKDNFMTTLESNDDLAFSAAGTGDIIVENLRFTDGSSSAPEIFSATGNIVLAPNGSLIIANNTALGLPVGTPATRRNAQGDIRFNSETKLFEGYTTANIAFGGLYSSDQQTFINVNQLTDNHIDFHVAGNKVGTINSTQVEMSALKADDILIDGSTITTSVSNSDLEMTANGTGKVVITTAPNLELSGNLIKNLSATTLEIIATDNGYHKMGGTYGVRIPTGDNSNRDAGDSVPNQVGDTRYNTTGGGFLETWDGNIWAVSAGGGGETISQAQMEDLILEFSLALG